jgi:L-lactate dehydrogenase
LQISERTKGSGAEVIRRKGGAGWAVGLTSAEVVHAIAHDRRLVLPASPRVLQETFAKVKAG